MKPSPSAILAFALLLAALSGRADAHFQVLLPASDVVAAGDEQVVVLDLHFTHPMEQGPVMEMAAPRQFGVLVGGEKHDLAKQLRPRKLDGKSAYTAAVKTGQPSDYVFCVEPAPYWEAAERQWIIHYTKVVVDVLGAEEGWDAAVGLPVEVEMQPLFPRSAWEHTTRDAPRR
jgi:cobalt/nickel transport protein